MNSRWDGVPLSDDDFLAAWYRTIDEFGEAEARRQAVAMTPGDEPPAIKEAAIVAQEESKAQTFAERLAAATFTSEQMDHFTPPVSLIDGVLYLDSLAWLIGEPANGKSFIALDWAGHVSEGWDWLGREVRGGHVIYVCPEGVSGTRLRKQAWEAMAGTRMSRVHFVTVPIMAMNAGHWAAFITHAKSLDPVLVILDTQARMTVGMEENSAKDMGEWVDLLERLRAETKACVLVVHHKARKSTNMRGSTALEGAAGTIINSTKVGNDITLSADPKHGGKTKDTEPFPDVTLRLTPFGESVAPRPLGGGTGKGVGKASIRSRPLTATVRDGLERWWETSGNTPIPWAVIDANGYFSSSTFYRHLTTLVNRGLVTESGTAERTLYTLRRHPDE